MNAKMKKFLSVLLAASMTLGSISSLSTAVTANELTDQTETSSQQDENASQDDSQELSDNSVDGTSNVDDASATEGSELTDASQTEDGTDGSAGSSALANDAGSSTSVNDAGSTDSVNNAEENTASEQKVEESQSESAYNSLSAVQLDENGDILYVRASAEQGVIPEGSTFTAKLVDTAEEKEKADTAVSSLRESDQLLADSYLLDLSFQDAEGNAIEPNGEVNLTFGLADTGSLSEKAASAIEAALSEQIMTKVKTSVTISDEQTLSKQTKEALEEELSLSYQLSDLSLSLYHLTSNADASLSADKVELQDTEGDSDMTNAGLIRTGKVSSFSQYQIELSKENSYADTVNAIAKELISSYSPLVIDESDNIEDGLAFSYRIKDSDTVDINTIVSGLQEAGSLPTDVNIISGSCSDSNVTVEGSGRDRSFTVPVGGDSYAITLYDENGSFYSVNLYSDLPAVSTSDSTSFTINWNDNGGNDEANLVSRPTWSEISDNYVLMYSITSEDGEDQTGYQELTKDALSAYGLTDLPNLDPDTDSSITSWSFALENLPTSYTQNTGDGKKNYTISYAIKQTAVTNGYVNDGADDSDSLIEMNSSITNTVQVLFQTKLIWKDNDNAYNTRPPKTDIAGLLANGTIRVMRYEGNSSAKPVEITDSVTADNFSITVNADGSESISITGLPAYSSEEDNYGAPYIYSIIFTPHVNEGAADSSDSYVGTYSNVDNYASYTGSLYNGGTLTEVLSNTIDFSYTKTWSDNNNNNRPDAKLYFYVATEDDVTSGSFNTNKASAVDGYSTVAVEKEDGTYTVCTGLPKYNDQGQKLVYFAIEKGLSGDYVSGVDNTNASTASQDVIDVFNHIKGSYLNRDTRVYYPKYLLNGGSIDNKLSATTKAEVTKTIHATAMQEMNGAEVNFVLQKMVSQTAEDGSISYQWVNATNGDLDGHDSSEEGDVTLTLNGFRAESMTQSGSSPDLKKYNDAGEVIIYRWKEVSVSMNGSDVKELTWDERNVSPDSMTYETAEDVSIGKYAPGIGDEMVDFYLSGKTTTSVNSNGSTETTIDNNINAPYLLKIEKTWTVKGENVTSKLPKTAYAVFEVRDGDGNVVKDENGNPIQITLNASNLTSDGSKWEMVYSGLDRFDANGREYTYSIKEIKMDDGGYLAEQDGGKWSKETTYSMAVAPTNAADQTDETAKEMIANVSNYYVVDPGNTVYLAAQKVWKDDGDLISRKPVIVGIYYIGEEGSGLVDTMTLTESGLWYKKTHVTAGETYYQYTDGQWTAVGTLPADIKSDDFLIVELGTGSTSPVTVSDADGKTSRTIDLPTNENTLTKMNFSGSEDDDISQMPENWRDYLEWSAADLSSMKNAIGSSDSEIGLLADDTYDNVGDSNYTYSVSERTGYIDYAEINGYIITDTRVGKVNLDLTKTWADGGDDRAGHFALYQDGKDTPVFEFDLGVNHDISPAEKVINFVQDAIENILGISLDSTSSTGSISAFRGATYRITVNTEVNQQTNQDELKSYEIQLEGLPKYDENGVLLTYTLKETAIYNDEGEAVEVKNGSASVDGHQYSSSCGLDTSKGENGTIYGDLHHNNDWIYWKASNSLTGSYNLNFYKVWYDSSDEIKQRPNIYFDIYRVSTNVWINNNQYTLKDWLESDSLWKQASSLGTFSTQEAAFSALFSKYYSSADSWSQVAEKVTTITADRYYDAAGNKYLWSIDVGDVAQYDEDGYPYIYFAVENGISKDSAYYGNEFYGNMSWDSLHVDTDKKTDQNATAKETYDYYSYENYSDYVSNSLLVLSDGVHSRNGDAGAYYSRTIVNEKQETRTISGRKIWNTIPFSVSTDDLPTVKMALYRSTTPINGDQELGEYSQSQMEKWIKDSSAEEVAEFTLHDKTAGDYSSTSYTYRIKYEDLDLDGVADTHTAYDADGAEETVKTELPKYDQYGNIYYYYAIELGDKDGNQIQGYQEDPTYNAAYFYLTNTYDVTKQPYVKVQVGKNWSISEEALKENPDLQVKDLSPVDISLYAVMQDENGDPVGEAVKMQTITYDPNAKDSSVYDSFLIDETTGTIYASFDRFEAANSTIPYYAPNGRPFLFYVTESSVNGYDSKITIGDKSYSASDQNNAKKRHYITLELNEEDSTYYNAKDESLAFDNTYNGEPTVSFNPVKKWADGYVNNSAYRPAKIRLTITRSSNGVTDKSWSRTITFSKTESNASASEWTVDNSGPSSAEVAALKNLPKYDTKGYAYSYSISKEEFLDENDQLIGTANKVNDLIGDYQLSEQNANTLKNKLNDSVSINLKKNWTYKITNSDSKDSAYAITWEKFKSLREMNALPTEVKFLVERSSDGVNWSSVDASSVDSDHKITLTGSDGASSDVVGYKVDLNSITEDNFGAIFNTSVKWENLPAKSADGSAYSYRVSEILTWKSGTKNDEGDYDCTEVKYVDGTEANGITSTITSHTVPVYDDETHATTTVYNVTAKNELETKALRLAKVWVDDRGRDYTRPDSLEMTITSANGSHTFSLNTSGATGDDVVENADGTVSSTYYSDYIYIPAYITQEQLSSYFEVTEVAINTATYEASEVAWSTETEEDGSSCYLATITNTLQDDRKTINLGVNKKWDDSSSGDWEKNLRPTMKFTLQYLKQGGNKNNSSDWISMTDTAGDSCISGFTLIPADVSDYTAKASYTVDKDTTVQDWMWWKYLKKYWDTPSVDGKSELIYYRVIEERTDGKSLTSSSYVCEGSNILSKNPLTYGYAFNLTDNTNTATGTITNKLKPTTISIKKNWKEERAPQASISEANVKKLVDLKALPEYIRFRISTYIDSKGHTQTIEDPLVEDFKVTDLASSTVTTTIDLPRYDQYGGEIEYNIQEYQVKYKGGNWQNASGGIHLHTEYVKTGSGNPITTVTFTNSIDVTNRTVSKSFLDENNRDGLQGDVVIQLYRDGEAYGDQVKLNAKNNWTYTWSLLPSYKNDANSGSESVYTYKEVSVNGKAVTGSASSASGYHYSFDQAVDGDQTSGGFTNDYENNTGTANLTNIHRPYRGTITATKSWDDLENYYGSESTVYLALQYKDPSTNKWKFVTANAEFDSNGQYFAASGTTIPTAYTSSALVQAVSKASDHAKWENVPVNCNINGTSSKLTYRVVEVTAETKDNAEPTVKDSNTIDGYTVNYPSGSFEKNNQDDQKLNLTVTNTLIKQTASISKIWSDDDSWSSYVRPDSLLVTIGWTHGSQSGEGLVLSGASGSNTVVGTRENPITLDDGNSWQSSDFDLPLYDIDGNAYSYTITEQYKFGNAVINKSGYTMDLSIDAAANSNWQIEKASGSENSWTLSRKETGASASESTDTALSLKATNSLIYGSLTVNKIWDDDQNREADRKNITVQLYRDGVAFGDEVTLSPESWSHTWNNLPVYQQNGTNKSNYTIKETNAETGWSVSYSPANAEQKASASGIQLKQDQESKASITNTIEPNYFTVSATKKWEDANDRYNVSASYLYVKLQYSTDRENWTDVEHANSKDAYSNSYADGAKVYTTSDLIQKITIEKIGNVRTSSVVNWENLPEKVRTTTDATGGSSAKVYYRVVECNSPTPGEDSDNMNAYYSQLSTIVSYDDIGKDAPENTAAITLTNTLPMGSLMVSKSWDDSDSSLRPDQVTVELYRKMNPNDDTSWTLIDTQTLNKGSADSDPWTYTWDNLPVYDKVYDGSSNPTPIQYRVVESSTINGYSVSYSASDDISASWTSTPVELSLTKDATVTSYMKNTQTVGSISVDKTWVGDSGLESERPTTITYELWRSDNSEKAYKVQTVDVDPTDGSASYTWSNLPVYGKDGKAFTYKVVEQEVSGYESSYSSSYPSNAIVDNSVTLDKDGHSAAITVTNTLKVAQLRVIKKWLDEDNRDQIRPAANESEGIKVQLYRDGEAYGDQVTIYQQTEDANTWTYEWTNLPYYQTGSSNPSVYYVKETTVDGYTTIYNDGSSDYSDASKSSVSLQHDAISELIIKNIHTPKKSSLTAAKEWDDHSDLFSKRPDSIYLSLMYQTEGSDDWSLVTQAEAVSASGEDVRYADGGVHTTSKVIQELQTSYEQNGNRQTTSWENLPQTVVVDGLSKTVSYQVFETDAEGNAVGKSANGYRVSYDKASLDDASADPDDSNLTDSASVQLITNKLMTTSMTISKSWIGDKTWGDITRPSKITFLVEYSLDGGESWAAYSEEGENAVCKDGYVTMSGDSEGAWQDIVLNDLPLITEDGTSYQYRVSEYSIEINGQTILCLGKEDASEDATLTADAEKEENAKTICSKAGAYDAEVTTKQNDDETWTVTAVNSLATGSVSVSKTWADGNNRDGLRPGSISLDLHRVDKIGDKEYDEVIDSITIEAENDGSWPTYTWNNLPIYSRDGSGKASYYVKEADTDNYSSSYEAVNESIISSVMDAAGNVIDRFTELTGLSKLTAGSDAKADQTVNDAKAAASTISADATAALKVTNIHEADSFTVTASKIWDDNANARGLRDSSVSFTLQYSLDQGETWQKVTQLKENEIPDAEEDQGSLVWTSSDVTQTISGKMIDSEWKGFIWENLPAHALDAKGRSVEVQYRVTEEVSKNTSANYTVTEGSVLSYGKAKDNIASTSITNTVKPANPVNPDNNDSTKPDSKTNTNSASRNVKTGDDSQYILWALLMTGAFVSMLYTGARYKRKKNED